MRADGGAAVDRRRLGGVIAPVIAGLALALVIGIVLGLLGGGGAILTVPVFAYVMGMPAKTAIAMTLPVIAATSVVGVIGHWRAGRVDPRAVVVFGGTASLAAFGGARLSALVTGEVQLAVLGIVIVGAAVAMLRPVKGEDVTREAAPWPVVAGAGVGAGLLTGFTGAGGGFVIVPALVFLARLPMKTAVGTSLGIIVLNTLAGFLGYAGEVPIDWRVLVPFTGLAVVGILVGTRLVDRVPAATLRRGFALLLLAIGALILWQNLGALRG